MAATSLLDTRTVHFNSVGQFSGVKNPYPGMSNGSSAPSEGTSRENPSVRGVTQLMQACQQSQDGSVRQLLHKDSKAVDIRDKTGKTALHYCVENTALTCIDQVLNTNPNLLGEKDEDGYTALHLATIAGNKTVAKYLLSKGADVHARDNEEHTTVHWATVCGEVDLLDILIEAGADPSTPDIHGAYPIHYAAQMCGPNSEMGHDVHVGLQVLQKLLQRGVDVAVRDRDGRQPLLWAASAEVRPSHVYCPSGSADAILALVNAGANVAAEDKDGLTALHCAASRGHLDCLDVLISLCSAEVDTLDSNGCTPLFYAVTLGHADCTELILQHGSNPDRQDRKGRTAVHCGAAKGQLETLKLLQRHGADLWKRNIKGDLPLHEACQSGRIDLVLWLLSQQPNALDSPNNDGRCPLHIAAINNNTEMCKILMDRKATVNPIMRNSRGQLLTPVDAAVARGHLGCAKYLQLHGGLPASKLTDKRALQIAMQKALETGPGTDSTGATPSDLSGNVTDASTPIIAKTPSTLAASPSILSPSTVIKAEIHDRNQSSVGLQMGSSSFGHEQVDSQSQTEAPQQDIYRQNHVHVGQKDVSSEEALNITNNENENQDTKPQNTSGSEDKIGKDDNEMEGDNVQDDQDKSDKNKISTSGEEKTNNVNSSSEVILDKHAAESDSSSVVSQNSYSTSQTSQQTVISQNEEQKIDNSEEYDDGDTEEESDFHENEIHTNITDQDKETIIETQTQDEKEINKQSFLQTSDKNISNLRSTKRTMKEKDSKIQRKNISLKSKENSTSRNERDAEIDSSHASKKNNKESKSRNKNINKQIKSRTNSEDVTRVKKSNRENIKTRSKSLDKPSVKNTRNAKLLKKLNTHTDSESLIPAREMGDGASEHSEALVVSGNDSGANDEKIKTLIRKKRSSRRRSIKTGSTKTGPPKNAQESDADQSSFESQEEEKYDSEASLSNKSTIKAKRPRPQSAMKTKNPITKAMYKEHLLMYEDKGIYSNDERTHEMLLTSQGSEVGLVRDAPPQLSLESDQNFKRDIADKYNMDSPTDMRSQHSSDYSSDEDGYNDSGFISRRIAHMDGNESNDSEDQSNNEVNAKEKRTKTQKNNEQSTKNIKEKLRNKNGRGEIESKSESDGDTKERNGGKETEYAKNKRRKLRQSDSSAEQPKSRRFSRSKEQKKSHRVLSGGPRKVDNMDHNLKYSKASATNDISVNRVMQGAMRKYKTERRLFQQLLDLKRQQIRNSRANEHVMIKRLLDEFMKEGGLTGIAEYNGPYTFSGYEKYLYDQLRLLQSSQSNKMPHFNNNEDVEKLTRALRKANVPDFNHSFEDRDRSAQSCNRTTHRCHHAIHAYTGVPCAAYLAQYHRNQKAGKINLPKIQPSYLVKAPDVGKVNVNSNFDPRRPIKLELQHGNAKQRISLPTSFLDQSQDYQLTVSIQPSKKSHRNQELNITTETENLIKSQEELGKKTSSAQSISGAREPQNSNNQVQKNSSDTSGVNKTSASEE